MANSNPKFSVVIPIFNEEESVLELIKLLENEFEKLNESFELIFIDDGSNDNTLRLLKEKADNTKNINIYSFRRNLGKATALTYGFMKSNGKFIITMDADLQDDPINFQKLIEAQRKGDYDLVSGWRKNRKDSLLKKLNSKFFNNIIIPFLFQVKFYDMNTGLKLYKQELVKEIKLYGGMHRFVPIIATEMGFKVYEEPIVHHERKYGFSKFKSTKILTDIPDLITMYFLIKYTKRPLHFFAKLGGFLLLLGVSILTYLIFVKLMGEAIGQRPLLIFGVLFVVAGLQTIFTGLLADLFVNFQRDNYEEIPLKFSTPHE